MRWNRLSTLGISLLCVFLAAGTIGAFGQTERWIHTYDGPAHMDDIPPSTIIGGDGNIYCAGYGYGSGTGVDIVVLSVDPDGEQRWVYRYDNSGNDGANAIVYGPGGYLYVAGQSAGPPTDSVDLVVICLDTTGVEQWVYRYNGPGDLVDGAYDIHAGVDGNLYVAGFSGGVGTEYDATVISLEPDGTERWVYRYDGLEHGQDRAFCVSSGQNGMVYAGGYSRKISATDVFMVIALDTGGNEKWIYTDSGPYAHQNAAYALTFDPAGDLLAAGTSGDHDFAVLKMDWKTGVVLWRYTWPTPTFNQNRANAVICGDDGMVYVAGSIEVMLTMNDFVVVSLDGDGNQRWVYRYNGSGNQWDEAWSLTQGPDGTLFAGGQCHMQDSFYDALVVSLDDDGGFNWSRLINGSAAGSGDSAESVVFGEEGHIYVGGFLVNDHGRDFAVIKIDTDNTVSAEIECIPDAGTLPFETMVSVGVFNAYRGQVRKASARIDLTLAGGRLISGWRSGYMNIQPNDGYETTILASIPLSFWTVGENRFRLVIEDTSPSPYNQPPYPPSGDTDTDLCIVTGCKSSTP